MQGKTETQAHKIAGSISYKCNSVVATRPLIGDQHEKPRSQLGGKGRGSGGDSRKWRKDVGGVAGRSGQDKISLETMPL